MAAPPRDDLDRTVARGDRAAPHSPAPAETSAGADFDTPNDPIPTVRPDDPAGTAPVPAASGPYVPGFAITGEIARGGMGAVLTAVEVALNREVAIKVLLPGAAGSGRAARRFVEEARITARLQHPGIPPIHQIGALPDGRPFLAMKLIRGRTLAAVLTARHERPSSNSAEELDLTALNSPGLLQVFEQICHAVGYAHAQGVVHRDLKPANVMVGSFGEVQVMDWGIARDARTSAEPGTRNGLDPTNPEGGTEGLEGPEPLTTVGRAMGTPQFMPPEQARGDWPLVDARADVFSLGGILAVILTGHPPYTGETPYAVLRRAEAGDLGECFARLDASGADPDLIALARWCLAPDPADRPANGTEVARQVAVYRLSVEARLVAAETERAAAAVLVDEARRRSAVAAQTARVAADRAAAAERYAEQLAARADESARRCRGVFLAVVLMVVVLSGVWGNYREQKGRAALAAIQQPAR